MSTEKDPRLAAVNKQIFKMHLLTVPANLAIGLGLYGVVTSNAGQVLDILADPVNCYWLLGLGVVAEIAGMKKLFPLIKEQARLKQQAG